MLLKNYVYRNLALGYATSLTAKSHACHTLQDLKYNKKNIYLFFSLKELKEALMTTAVIFGV